MTRILIFNGFFCNSDSFKSYKLFIKNIVQFITIEEKTYIFSSSENKLLLKCSNNSKRNILKSLFSSWINYEMLGFERGGGLLLCVSGVSLHMYSILLYWVDTLSNFLLEISWIWKREPKSNICLKMENSVKLYPGSRPAVLYVQYILSNELQCMWTKNFSYSSSFM